MSYSASPDVTYRIAIGDAASRAYGSVLNNFRLAAAFAWLPLAIVLGMEVIGLIVGGGGFVGRILASLAGVIGFLLFGTTFAVRWSRFILLGEKQSGELFPPGWRPMMVVTVKICLGILAGVAVVALIAMPAPFWLKILIWALGALFPGVSWRCNRAAARPARRLGRNRGQLLALPGLCTDLVFAAGGCRASGGPGGRHYRLLGGLDRLRGGSARHHLCGRRGSVHDARTDLSRRRRPRCSGRRGRLKSPHDPGTTPFGRLSQWRAM